MVRLAGRGWSDARNRDRSPALRLVAPALAALALLTSVGVAQGRPGVSGGVYLYHYQPVDLPGVEPNSEIYAAFATVERRADSWTLHVQGRARDTKFRPYFPGTVWLQEAWVAYQATSAFAPVGLRLRAGKFHQVLGRDWDGSFFGNLQYFDGLKLNPQLGLEASGTADLGPGAVTYAAQYLLASDRVSGALAGRDFETLEGFRNQDSFAARVTFSLLFGVTLGASYMSRGVDTAGVTSRVPHVALDVEMGVPGGPASAYVEWSRRGRGSLPASLLATPAGARATYWLAGLQLRHGAWAVRYNFSRARYDETDRRESIHQPGVTVALHRAVQAIVELDLWGARDAAGWSTVDRSLSFVLLLAF